MIIADSRVGRRPAKMLALYLLSVASACGLSVAEHRVVDRWLLCDECTAGELDSVRALGSSAVRRLATALLDGPPQDRRQLMRDKFTRSYASIQPPPSLSQADYVNDLMSNYVARYQRQSATALRVIGGADARDALDEALAPAKIITYRNDVAQAISYLRSTLDATPYGGTVTPGVAGVGDTVRVAPAQPGGHSGDELAALEGAAFAPSDVLISVSPQQLVFLGASPLGRHALSISNVGNTTDTETTSLGIITELDQNDRATVGCATVGCALDRIPTLTTGVMPHLSILTLRRSPALSDTLDLFKVVNTSPASPLQVTAHLDWPVTATANLDLRWTLCTMPTTPAGNRDGATFARPEVTSVAIPPGVCWILAVLMPSGGVDRVFAKLRVTSP